MKIGITLVALIITIVILILLVVVTIKSIIDHNIIPKVIQGAESYAKAEDKEMDLLDRIFNLIKSQDKNNEDEKTFPVTENDSLTGKVAKVTENGIQNIEVNGEIYSANVVIYNGDLVLDGTKEVAGAVLADNIYEFGNKETDVAIGTENAKNMVILKVNGNLTINEGITLTACKSDEGLGGPKGLLVYSEGTLTNNGTISMTARGARSEGQNVYLWKNQDGSYEYVPAEGGNGATGASAYGSTWVSGGWYEGYTKGNNAPSSSGRALAGGGSGAIKVSNQYTVRSSEGAKATSYSGGSGSGGTFSAKASITGYAPEANGGKGGKAYADENVGWTTGSAGGAGNPGGEGYTSSGSLNQTRKDIYDGENGTRRIINNIC